MDLYAKLLLLFAFVTVAASQEPCVFSVNQGQIHSINETAEIGSEVFDFEFKSPANSSIKFTDVSGTFANFYRNKFLLSQKTEGFATVVVNDNLTLPPYPSTAASVYLKIHIDCAGRDYELGIVQVNDVNNFSPQFYNFPANISISEKTPINSSMPLDMIIIDFDPSHDYDIVVSNEPNDTFAVEEIPGVLVTRSLLPADLQNANWAVEQLPHKWRLKVLKSLSYGTGNHTFLINITAKDKFGQSGYNSNSRVLTVSILDSDNRPPMFSRDTYKAKISANDSIGMAVVFDFPIEAKHSGPLKYSLIFSNPVLADYFTVDTNVPRVRLKQRIPADLGRISIRIRAEQIDNPAMESSANLLITIDGVDNNTNCTGGTEQISLPPYSPAGMKIFQLPPEARNLGGLNDQSNSFIIDYNTGWLVLNRSDFTSNDSVLLYIYGALGNSTQPCLTLNITAIGNDSATIVFDSDRYTVTVRENILGEDLIKVSASTEKDLELTYSLQPDSNSEYFAINPKTGVIRVVEPLDFELQPVYNLTVLACEKTLGSIERPHNCAKGFVEVTLLDANDNRPKFDQNPYEVQIPRDLSPGSLVAFLHANDNDSFPNGAVSYILKTPTAQFSLDYNTGQLSLADSIKGENDKFELEIEAFDHGTPQLTDTTRVIITINGTNANAPEFEKFFYTAVVEENSPNGTFVAKVHANDADNETVEYFIPEEPGSKYFQINSDTGEIRTSGIPVDYELIHQISILVGARDKSVYPRSTTTLLTVKITDTNDNSPIFPPLPDNLFMSTSKAPGDVILTLNAYDKDGWENGYNKIRYSVQPTSKEFGFGSELSNQLVLKQTVNEGSYPITLHMEDSGTPANKVSNQLNIVVLPGLNHYPLFKSLTVALSVDHFAKFPQLLYTFKAETAVGGVEYHILNGPQRSLTLDRDLGQLYAEESIIDEISFEPVQFIVRAVNTEFQSKFSDVSVIIGRLKTAAVPNLHFPASQYRAEIDEELPINSHLNVSVQATEASNELSYSIYPNDTFAIGNNGDISVAGRIDAESLDPKLHGILTYLVVASDGNNSASTTLQIKIGDVNEFAPAFEHDFYQVTVYEDTPAGSLLTGVKAFDRDATDKTLTYSIVEGEGAKYIEIPDKTKGLIYKSENLFEQSADYNVSIEATDKGGKKSSTVLNLQVVKRSVNAPIFIGEPYRWAVTEGNATVGSNFIITVGNRENVSFRLLYGNKNNSFQLRDANRNSVKIYVAKELDRETLPFYTLAIEAKDLSSGSSSITTVEITVVDINDNPPRFDQSAYQSIIPADFPVGYTILTVFASDPDENSNLTFRLLDDNSGTFKIDRTTGQISLLKPLQAISSVHGLVAAVSDGSYESQVNVSITSLWDKNASVSEPAAKPPKFDQTTYEFTIPEGESDISIGRVTLQNIGNKPIFFSVQPEFYQKYFRVSNETGEIFVLRNLSYTKEINMFPFVVLAQEDRIRTFAQIVAKIKDKNDHKPEFSQSEFVGLLPSNAVPGYSVKLGIKATDLDEGINAQIKYSLNGSDAHCFDINSTNGVLNLKCAVDPSISSYTFNVIATDENGLGLSTVAPVHILVHIVEESSNRTDFNIESSTQRITIYPSSESVHNVTVSSQTTLTAEIGKPSQFITTTPSPIPITVCCANETTTVVEISSFKSNVTHNATTFAPVPITECCANGTVSTTVTPETVNTTTNTHSPIPVTGCCDNESSTTVIPVSQLSTNENSHAHLSTILTVTPLNSNTTEATVTRTTVTIGLEATTTAGNLNNSTFVTLPTSNSSNATGTFATSTNSNVPTATDKQQTHSAATTIGQTVSNKANQTDIATTHSNGFSEVSVDQNVTFVTKPTNLQTSESSQSTRISDTTTNGQNLTSLTKSTTAVGTDVTETGGITKLQNNSGTTPTSFTGGHKTTAQQNGTVTRTSQQGTFSTTLVISNGTELTTLTSTTGGPSELTVTQYAANVTTLSTGNVTASQNGNLTTNQFVVSTMSTVSSQNIVEHNCSLRFVSGNEKLTLIEHSPITTPIFVAMVLPDGHFCNVTYNLEGMAKDYFHLNSLSGLMTTAKDLDIQSMASQQIIDRDGQFQLILKATVYGYPAVESKLTVRLVKFPPAVVNPAEVHFNQSVYIFNVDENEPNGTLIGRVLAESNDSSITYSILFSKLFTVDRNTGEIRTVVMFDYEVGQHEFSFLIKASSLASTDYASVLVNLNDLNDHSPAFAQTSYSFEILEAPYKSLTIGQIKAVDRDSENNSVIAYNIHESDIPFQIDSYTGDLQVIGNIDREQTDHYIFHVVATDNGIPALSANVTVNVTILDVNDNSPVFYDTPLAVSVSETTQPNQVIVAVHANDSDLGPNGKVLYELETYSEVFTINNEDGVIRLIKPLSAASQDSYLLTVVAYDLGKPPQKSYLNISVNVVAQSQNRPRFKQDIYFAEIFSDTQTDQAFYQLTAGTNHLQYSISESDMDLFTINNSTGQIYLKRHIRETDANKGYTLGVTAKNVTSGETATTKVRIYIMKGSATTGSSTATEPIKGFKQSQYWIDLMENLPPPQLVMDLNSTYELKGIPVRYEITSGNSDKFFINESSGQVYSIQPFDRENRSLFVLTVKVTPLQRRKIRGILATWQLADLKKLHLGGNETAIVVNITDQNDNKPEFDAGPFGIVLTMDPNTELGTVVGNIKAFDRDLNSHLSYDIVRTFNDDSTRFRLDHDTGVIIAGRNFQDIPDEKLHFVASVFDGNFTTYANVTVYKLNANWLAIIHSYASVDLIRSYSSSFERELSTLTGLEVSINKITKVVPNDFTKGSLDSHRLEIAVYGIDPQLKLPVHSDVLVTKINAIMPQLSRQFEQLRLQVQSVTGKSISSKPNLLVSVPEATLIAVCAIVMGSAIIGAVLLIKWWNGRNSGNSSQTYDSTAVASEAMTYESDTIDRKRDSRKIQRSRTQMAKCVLVPTSYLERCNHLPVETSVATLYEEISETEYVSSNRSDSSDGYKYATRL